MTEKTAKHAQPAAADSHSPGFKLPYPDGPAALPSGPGSSPPPVDTPTKGTPGPLSVPLVPYHSDTSQRDLAIGGGVLLLLMVGFFFAKKSYANMLVSKRVAPRSANASGWWLFVLLTTMAAAAVLGTVHSATLFAPLVAAGFIGVALVALILMLVTGRR